MRFNRPEKGTTRIVHKFLILPLTIGGETRWLENVSVLQEFEVWSEYGVVYTNWEPLEFLND